MKGLVDEAFGAFYAPNWFLIAATCVGVVATTLGLHFGMTHVHVSNPFVGLPG
jgi:hypothetical protein